MYEFSLPVCNPITPQPLTQAFQTHVEPKYIQVSGGIALWMDGGDDTKPAHGATEVSKMLLMRRGRLFIAIVVGSHNLYTAVCCFVCL